MKTAVIRQSCTVRPAIPFPNAATPRQIFHKILDGALMAACGIGLAAMFLLVLALAL